MDNEPKSSPWLQWLIVLTPFVILISILTYDVIHG